MTQALAGALGGGLLVIAGMVGLSLSLGSNTDEGGPVLPEPPRGRRIAIAAVSAVAVVAGFLLFGMWSS